MSWPMKTVEPHLEQRPATRPEGERARVMIDLGSPASLMSVSLTILSRHLGIALTPSVVIHLD